MKRILFLAYVILIYTGLQAQSYIPFPNRMVIYGLSHRVLSMGDEYWDPGRTEINGDTLIGSYHYAIVYSGVSTVTQLGGMRNDTMNKKVYFYSFATNTEKLFYDFDLSVGDTVNVSNGYGFYDPLVVTPLLSWPILDTAWVTSIDSIFMPHDGLYHRRFKFKGRYAPPFGSGSPSYLVDTTDAYWSGWSSGSSGSMTVRSLVEGVGQLYNPYSDFGEFEYSYSYNVWCASINGIPVVTPAGWPPPPMLNNMYCDQLFVGVNERTNPEMELFPNPFSDKVSIEVSFRIRKVEVYDVLGQLVFSSVQNDSHVVLELPGLSPGIYFIRINNSTAQKMIKQNN